MNEKIKEKYANWKVIGFQSNVFKNLSAYEKYDPS